MKFVIMSNEEAKKTTGWKMMMNTEFKGILPNLYCGYNFEVKKGNVVDFMCTTFKRGTPQEVIDNNEDWYKDSVMDSGLQFTGRVIFRGYFTEEWDEEEREYYFEEYHVE